MDETLSEETKPKKKSSILPLIIGLVIALAGGGSGFFAVYSGLILGPSKAPIDSPVATKADPITDIAFVEVEPLVISVGNATDRQHLRFRSQLEVASQYQGDVEMLLPRVVDVLNSYLRALELTDLEDPLALVRLRAQMLRRVQLVTGEGRVNDLLIMEFVLN
ncbi:MAG: flagellar basal body-associated FliL family protein [Marinovum sp.]|nr:flagellar basal body-associated FliL family protein [Marinovum sp.]